MKGNDEQLLTDLRERVEVIILSSRIDSEFKKCSGAEAQELLDIFSDYLEGKGVDLELPEIPLSERHGYSSGNETANRPGAD